MLATSLNASEEGWKTFDRGRVQFAVTSVVALGSLPHRMSLARGWLRNPPGVYGRDNRGFLLRSRGMAGRVSSGSSSPSVWLIFLEYILPLVDRQSTSHFLFAKGQARRVTMKPSRVHRGREELKEMLRPYLAEASSGTFFFFRCREQQAQEEKDMRTSRSPPARNRTEVDVDSHPNQLALGPRSRRAEPERRAVCIRTRNSGPLHWQ